MNSIIVSNERNDIVLSLKNQGFNIIESEYLSELIPYERRHADIQCLRINDTFFVLKSCQRLINMLKSVGKNVIVTDKTIKSKYPENVLLNAAFINNQLYCKESSLDKNVKKYCEKNKIRIINVNQGYTKCSTALISKYFITSDKGIFKTMSENGVEGLLIKSGSIKLPGTDYGFIGGCCFYINNTAYFTGNLSLHPDANIIKDFLLNKGIRILELTNKTLYDIGGFIIL